MTDFPTNTAWTEEYTAESPWLLPTTSLRHNPRNGDERVADARNRPYRVHTSPHVRNPCRKERIQLTGFFFSLSLGFPQLCPATIRLEARTAADWGKICVLLFPWFAAPLLTCRLTEALSFMLPEVYSQSCHRFSVVLGFPSCFFFFSFFGLPSERFC